MAKKVKPCRVTPVELVTYLGDSYILGKTSTKFIKRKCIGSIEVIRYKHWLDFDRVLIVVDNKIVHIQLDTRAGWIVDSS